MIFNVKVIGGEGEYTVRFVIDAKSCKKNGKYDAEKLGKIMLSSYDKEKKRLNV